MGLVVSLIVIAVGAILTWAVTDTAEGIDLDVVGVILMLVGLAGFLLSMYLWSTWAGPGYFRRRTYAEGAPPAGYGYRARRRTTYVEDEGPPGPPPGPPPPPP